MITGAALESICIAPDTSVGAALRKLDETHKRILLIVDKKRRLLGVVTDPDFRRAILARIDFEAPVETIMMRTPFVGYAETTEHEISTIMERGFIQSLPVIDRCGMVLQVVEIQDLLTHRSEQTGHTAVIMAGGLGSRLRPLTTDIPKPLIPVGGKPILFTIIDKLLISNINKIYVAVNYKAELIVEAIRQEPRYRDSIHFLYEEERMGTVGALSLLPHPPKHPFIVTNGDLLTNVSYEDILRTHKSDGNVMTVGLREESFQLPYGVVQLEGTRVAGIVEKPSYTHFINTGLYAISPEALDFLEHGVFFDATQLITRLIDAGKRVGSFLVREYWMDIGQMHQLEQARRDYEKIFRSRAPGPVGDGGEAKGHGDTITP
jgi:dTDP-glucose pyrophosphorylase